MLWLNGLWHLALDRTQWKIGKLEVNYLVLAAVTRRFRVPLIWTVLKRRREQRHHRARAPRSAHRRDGPTCPHPRRGGAARNDGPVQQGGAVPRRGAWIARAGEALVGRASVRFSDRADVEPIWRDVASGIIRNVSVGYAVRSYEITQTDGQPPVWRAVDWQPLSAVPIGAEAAAGFRTAGQSLPLSPLPTPAISCAAPRRPSSRSRR